MSQLTKCKLPVPKNAELSAFSTLSKGELQRTHCKLQKKNDVGKLITSSTESLIKCRDYSSLCQSITVSTNTLQKNNLIKKHAKLAALYKINLSTVKKHYSILTNIPKVSINKIIFKKEKNPTGSIDNLKLSPVFGSKRKSISKIKRNVKSNITLPDKNDIKHLITQNYSSYFKTLNSTINEDKIFTNNSQIEKFYNKINQEFQTSLPTISQANNVNKWKLIIDSSDDEFKVNCAKTVKSIAKSSITKSKIIKNPFFKVKNKGMKGSKSLQDKEKCFWTKEFDNNVLVMKKKEFKEKYNKINNKNKEISINKKVIFLNKISVTKKENYTENENKTNNKLKNKIKKKYKQVKTLKSSSTSDLSTKSSIDSLSVNCQILNKANEQDNHSYNSNKYMIVPNCAPTSFGSLICDQKQNFNIQNNIDDFNTNTLQNYKQYNQNFGILNNGSKIKEELDNSNDNFVTLDMYSSADLEFNSSSTKNYISNSISDSCTSNKNDKYETNSRTINNIMLSNNVILSPDRKYSEQTKFQSKISRSLLNSKGSDILCSKSKQTPCKNSIQEKTNNINSNDSFLVEIKDTIKYLGNSVNTTQQKNNYNDEFLQTKFDFNGGLKEHQTKINVTDNNNIDESFDSLCQVVSKLSKNENITLYKATQDNNSMENEKIILRLSKNNIQNSDFKMPIIIEKNEIHSSIENTAKKSPIIFQQSSCVSINQNSTSPENMTNSSNMFNRLQSQQTSHINLVKSPYTRAMDSKLHQSISPVKSLNLNEKKCKLNESSSSLIKRTSPLNPLISMGNITPNSENKNIRILDPRLRKRKMEDKTIVEISKDIQDSKEEKTLMSTFSIQNKPLNDTKKNKLSVFDRLGIQPKRTSSTNNCISNSSNKLCNIIEDDKNKKPKNNLDRDSDDDMLSLHPCERFSSDEEESNTSPRHNKFTSERTHINEEIKNQPISIKDRLSWNIPAKNCKPFPSKKTLSENKSNNENFIGTSPNRFVGATSKISFNQYSSDDIVFNENFYKMNTAQMLQDENNFKIQELEDIYSDFGKSEMGRSCKLDYISILNGSNQNTKSGIETKNYFFKYYCYRKLRRGTCSMQECHYFHKIDVLRNQIKTKKLNNLLIILNIAINSGFEYFITEVWSSILPILQNDMFRIYEKLYQANMRSDIFINDLLKFCLENKLHSVESFVKKISSTVQQGDRELVRIICAAVKDKLTDGFCWEAIKDLCQRAVPPHDIIELILIQCLKRKKNETHIAEVYNMVKNKLNALERNQISQFILKPFFTLVENKQINLNKEAFNTKPLYVQNNINNLSRNIQIRSESIDSIQSVENEKSTPRQQMISNTTVVSGFNNNKNLNPSEIGILSPQQPNNSPLEVRIATPNKGESTNFTDYVVTEIDANEPQSLYRDNFWKLYLNVHNVKEGLNHVDYKYVWKVMDEFSKENIQDELLRRAYYHILCKNVKKCEHHVTEVIKQAGNNNHVIIEYLTRDRDKIQW